MLDDLKYIHDKDSADALGAAAKMPQLLARGLEISGSVEDHGIENVVFAAMGDSSLAAMIAQVFPGITVPCEIVREYDLPVYAGASSLVVMASYSGNTEETLSIYAAAKAKGCRLAVISSGGKLLATASEENVLCVKLPKDAHPRYSSFSTYRAFLEILASSWLLTGVDYEHEIHEALPVLDGFLKGWAPDSPSSSNRAKQLALELMGRSVVIYSGPLLYPAAYKWKLAVNQNAKQVAWLNQLPEYNHNEMTGWTKQPVDKPYAIIELLSSLEHPRIQKRFEVDERLTSGMHPEAVKVLTEGKTLIEQLLYAMVFGEMVSIYLALLNGVDPSPLKLVDKFKEVMGTLPV